MGAGYVKSREAGFLYNPLLCDVRERERADEYNKGQALAQPAPIVQNLSPPLAGNCERTRADFAQLAFRRIVFVKSYQHQVIREFVTLIRRPR